MQTKDTNQKEWLIEGYALESGWLWPRKGISTRTHRLCCSTEMSIIPYNWYISWNLSSSPMSPLMGLTRGRIGSEAALITLADFGVVQYMLSFQPAHKHITTISPAEVVARGADLEEMNQVEIDVSSFSVRGFGTQRWDYFPWFTLQ